MRPPIDHVTPESIAAGLARVRESIASAAATSARSASDVTIVAAVKYIDAQACADLVAAGVRDLAESRASQLDDKQRSGVIPPEARWHFIGRLQSREAPQIAQHVDSIHSLCSPSAAARLARADARCELLVQVNIAGDPAKDGIQPVDVERFLAELPEQLTIAGFMAMPAFAEDPEQSRGAFAALRELRDELAPAFAGRHELRELSIGTSQDYVVAVEEGATRVRLGRVLYAGGE
jgi:pyridoxal phosphate enzyme (YggS family)